MRKPFLIFLVVCGLFVTGCSDDDPAPPPSLRDDSSEEIIYDTGEVTDDFVKDELMAAITSFTTDEAGVDETKNIEMFEAEWDVRFKNYSSDFTYKVMIYVLNDPTTDRLRDWTSGRYVGHGKLLTEITSSHPRITAILNIDYDYAENALYFEDSSGLHQVVLDDHGENLFLLCVGYINVPDSGPYIAYQVNALKTRN